MYQVPKMSQMKLGRRICADTLDDQHGRYGTIHAVRGDQVWVVFDNDDGAWTGSPDAWLSYRTAYPVERTR